LGKNVLGFTEFGPRGVEAVPYIGEPPGDLIVQEERRVNSTLAHEAGHGLMHAQLFVEHFANQTPIEGHPNVTETRIRCREERPNTVRQKEYEGDRWEFQANRAIGALLMPKQLLPILFPNLCGTPWAIKSRKTRRYNCLAWAAREKHRR